ncbi:hypothetical protein PRZ48_000096 [Zasmidium cellare]|uniref:Uncharacterized protein n=1 Tax=Zasmidium cellare TaxID=395010 RepID=A0ABR0EYX1_ZASCE|nr:hypothetical protein PRZ48_000096 [Zasmidium cellare]
MITPSKLSFLLAAVGSVDAFSITFYAGVECRGERLGGGEVSIADGCQDGSMYNGIASSVLISPTGDEETGIVSFYEGQDCPLENSVAAGNDGCLTVGAGLASFGSYNVIGAVTGPSVRKRTHRSVGPRSLKEIKHGDVFEHDNHIWRWQQIAEGTFRGVLAQEWDSEVRIQGFEPLDFGKDYPFNFTEYYLNHPEMANAMRSGPVSETGISLKRQAPNFGLEPFCRKVTNCVYAAAILADFYFPAQTQYVVNALEAARQQATLENLWTFLGQPVVVPASIGIGTGVATGYISARYFSSSPQPAEGCSQANDAAVLAELINSGAVGEDQVSAVRNQIRDNDVQSTGDVVVALVPDQEPNTGQYCGAPVA